MGKVVGRLNWKCNMGRMCVALWVKKWNTEVHTATAAPHVLSWFLVPHFGSRARFQKPIGQVNRLTSGRAQCVLDGGPCLMKIVNQTNIKAVQLIFPQLFFKSVFIPSHT